MWAFLGTCVVCATIIYCVRYAVAPYTPYKETETPIDTDKEPEHVPSFDDIIAEVYGRLDEEADND